MAFIQNWMMGEAERLGNIYTKTHAASQLALYCGRLILAYNRVLFPYHKWFLHYLRKCENKPPNFEENIKALLKAPNTKNASTLFQSIQNFKNWGVSDLEAYDWFMKNVEWGWMEGNNSIEGL